jgi:hypothetical protein
MSDTTLSIRDAIDDAMPVDENELAAAPEAAAPEPSPSEATPPADAQAPSNEPSTAESANPEADPKQPREERLRDQLGKFAKKADEGMQAGPKSEPQKQAREDRAPQSWKPETREHWAAIPAEVKSEIVRREREFAVAMQETAEQRRFADAVMKTIAPYEMFIKADNSNPLQAIDNLMGTAAKLRTGTAPELASLMSNLIQQFGVGRFGQGFIESLDQALVGQVPQVDPREQAIRRQLEQEIAPVRQFMSELQQQKQMQEQMQQQAAGSEVQGFLANHEFAMDVKDDMADLIELASKRGREMSLEEAYDRACRAHPEIGKIFQKRDQASQAASRNQVAQRARAASVSVGGAPTPSPSAGQGGDLRSALESAFSAQSR